MTTADTTALTERIARAFYENRVAAIESDQERRSWPAWEDHERADADEWRDAAAAVLPIIAVEVRKAKAEALRDAKGRVYASSWWADGSDNYADRVRGFLGTLAAEYEAGDSDEHR